MAEGEQGIVQRPEHFATLRARLADHYSLPSLAKYIVIVRTVFNWGYESDLLLTPVKYANKFDAPTKRVLRLDRAGKPKKLFDACDIRKLIDKSALTRTVAVPVSESNLSCIHFVFAIANAIGSLRDMIV